MLVALPKVLWFYALQEEVFNYIHNILSMPGYSAEEKQSVWQKALEHIEVQCILNPRASAAADCCWICLVLFSKRKCHSVELQLFRKLRF